MSKATMIVLVMTLIMFINHTTAAANEGFMNTLNKYFDSDAEKNFKHGVEKENTFCVRNFLEMTLEDEKAVKYIINTLCPEQQDEEYLTKKYGNRSETKHYEHGLIGKVYKYTDDDGISTAVKIPGDYNNDFKDVFLEVNASQCIKESLNNDYLQNYGIIKECVWLKGKDTPYMVMNYYNRTFNEKINTDYEAGWEGENFPKDRALNDMIKITEEVKNLHENGIAHTNLNTSNIRVDDNNDQNPVLVHIGRRGAYLSGEYNNIFIDAERESSTPKETDIYALCIIFFEIYFSGNGASKYNKSLDISKKIRENYKNEDEENTKEVDNALGKFSWMKQLLNKNEANKIQSNYRFSILEVYLKLLKMKEELEPQERLLI